MPLDSRSSNDLQILVKRCQQIPEPTLMLAFPCSSVGDDSNSQMMVRIGKPDGRLRAPVSKRQISRMTTEAIRDGFDSVLVRVEAETVAIVDSVLKGLVHDAVSVSLEHQFEGGLLEQGGCLLFQ